MFRKTFIIPLFITLMGTSLIAESPLKQDHGVTVDGDWYSCKEDYLRSPVFRENGLRCGTPVFEERAELLVPEGWIPRGISGDCTSGTTDPSATWDPNTLLQIPVVVHVITNSAGTQGVISDEMVQSGIDILNEDFLAMVGTNGANGNYSGIRFVLAATDPGGLPTNGITNHANDTWFNDSGAYWNTIAWDPNVYMNVYTNKAGGNLGYVPFLPADGGGAFVGAANDRVVILWDSFGRDAPIGSPYNLGRTLTHEVGHYLGLEHTFNGGCASGGSPGCYSNGDLICDTNPEQSPASRPCFVGASSSCGSVDPTDNYMDYSDDICMEQFTAEQMRRNRCSLTEYRPNLYFVVPTDPVFDDGFESGDTTAWSATQS